MRYRLFCGLAALALVGTTVTMARGGQDDLRPEQVAEGFLAAYNAHDVSRVMSFYSDDVVISTPDLTVVRGKPDNQKYYEAWFQSVPDVNSMLKSLTVGEDRFVLELVETGTYTKAMPTPGAPRGRGQKLRYPYVIVANVRAGKMTSVRIYENDKVIERQLGIR